MGSNQRICRVCGNILKPKERHNINEDICSPCYFASVKQTRAQPDNSSVFEKALIPNKRTKQRSAGRHAQGYCHHRFTHWMCTGYRFDNSETLKKINIDFPKSEGVIEILCSCSCHDLAKMFLNNTYKFLKAEAWTTSLFGDITN